MTATVCVLAALMMMMGSTLGVLDPCQHYTVLDDAWRAANNTIHDNSAKCDQDLSWQGWYRMYYRGTDAHMPEYCVRMNRCGTNAPLWLNGTHPQVGEGIVTRQVCGHWKWGSDDEEDCCNFANPPVRIKACPGNYYVYEFMAPTLCSLAYCTDVGDIALNMIAPKPTVGPTLHPTSYPSSAFYPFGQGDSYSSQSDDGSSTVAIAQTFLYFRQTISTIHVNNNGFLTFESAWRGWSPYEFPAYAHRNIIAPLWTDIDNSRRGTISYRQYTSGSVLQQATTDINLYFPAISFSASWVFVATWDKVEYYEHSGTETSFQVVLIAGGQHSFALMNYGALASTRHHVQAGYDTINSIHHFSIPGSFMKNFTNLRQTSNVNTPGRWAFQIDDGPQGCQFHGSAVQVGDSFWTDATCQQKCTCASRGVLQCQQQSCSFSEACKPAAFQYSCQNIQRCTCTINGDPHYYTFDRKLFHFMGTCTYVLSEACGNGLPYYRIEGKNEHRGSTRVSWTRLVRVWVYGEEIELVKGHRYNAMVNGTFVTTPFSLKDGAIRVYQSGQSLAVSTDFGLLVTYDAHHYVTISVPYEYQNGTCGLCGNFNHQPNDDFRTRSGQLVSSDVEFANSWKVARDTDPGCQDVSCAGLACAACTSSQKKLYGNTAHCGILSNNAGPFAACHSSLPPQNFEENCVYDLCVGGGYQPILCQGLTVYAAQCQQEGIQLGQWRRQGFCEISCPANSHFESQGTGCPATCSNPNAPKNCPLPNQESCICDAGYVLSAGECVRQGDCGCTFEGRYYGAGETVVLDEDCGRRCTCSHGSMTCQTHGCGDLEKCAVHEGVRGCRPASYETCWVESYESYRTFDGKTFHYPGACSLTLARVRGQSQLTHFQVTVEKVPKGLRDFVRTLKFETEGTQVSVEMGDGATTKVDGQTVGIPFSVSSGHIRIYHSSVKGVVIETDFGLLVRADWPHVIRITAPGNYNGTLGGLCGNLNGYPGDDFFSPTGVPLNNSQQFGDSWRDGSLSTHCVEPQVWEPGHYQNTTHFKELCGIMGSTNGPFGQCRANLDPSMQIEDCVQELERTQGAREALCEALRGYTLLCQQTGITVGEWRNLTNCEVTCPLNSHYEICGTSCPASCPSLSFPFLCNQQCQEGCQCDDGFLLSGDRCVPPTGCGCHHGGRYRQSGESYWYGEECQQICRCNGLTGQSHCTASSCSEQESCRIVDGQFGCHPKPEATCSASGDPHYTSFDRRKFDFQGTCRYVLASVCNGSQGLPHFQVEARNEAWKGLQVSITVAVYVNVSGHQVYISKYHPGTVQVNGETRNLPVLLDQGKVSVYGNGLHTFVTTDFGLTVSYDGRWVLDITVPSNYSGATCGLCGNFNGLQADDFMVQNEGSGSQVLSASDFGNYWKVDDGIPCTGGCGNSCPVCHDDRRARAICELLRASTGPLSFCHAHVDPQTFFNDCVFDVCLSGNRDDVFCRAMEAYVSACQAANVIIYPWRQNSTCQMECPENSHYDLCGTECGHTCASSIDASCDRTCAEGCFCDEGFVRSGGRCVPVEQCGCLYDGLYFEIGETFWSAGCSQRCECFGPDDLRCTQSSCPPTQECSVKDGRRGCHGQLSTCTVWGDQFNGSAVQVGDSFWTDATCQQKCTCASGGILQCQQQSCSFSEACKPAAFQYSCQNIQRRTCTISGDPHYYTFDRKLFHFMGTCTYVLSEACGNGLPYYRIEGKNEHRGSTRVSWTRLVRVWVYGEEIELVKGHRYNAMVNGTFVTTPFSLKDGAIRVYQSGQSLAVSTDFGLLVTYDAHHYVTISVPYEYQNGTCGLCGNFNHQRNDDFRTRSGQLVSSDVEFANSWKVAGDTDPGCQDVSCAGLACAACTSSQKKLYGNTAHCGILSNNVGPFAACHSSLPPQNFEENCVYDLCVGGGYQPILCQGLTVYAAQCQQEGIQLGQWRRQGFCEISCPANSHFESQGTGCPATCSNPNAPKNCPLPNQESCICDAGYVLSAGECVRQGDCGCTFEGRYYGAGETVVLDEDCGRRCTCSHGSMTCQTHGCGDLEKCAVHEGVRGCRPASYETCWVESYESYRTFDGMTFHYPGACSLTLARVRGQSQLTHFQVTVEKVPKGLRDFVRTLKFETEGTQVSVEMGDGATTKVDGQTVGIPFSVSSGHIRIYHSSVKGVVIETDFGLLVRADWPHVIRITAPGNYNGTLGGLCGNLNGYPGDDFFSPTGVPLNNSQQFGDSWRDGSLSTHCVEPQVWEPGHYQNTTHFRELCGIMGSTNGPFGQCRANLDPSMQIEDCVQELERTQGAREALCEALRGYTLLCQQTGITVGEWRNLTNCEVTCPLNSHYEICGTSCPASCPSLSFPFLCNQQCQEGCQCDDGFLLSGDRCVPPTGCGCHHGGRYRQSGESYWYGEECQQICRCNGLTGQSHCTASSCSEQESCRIVDGQFGCHPKPEATCSASGDPHYTSFDRRKFDFQGTCRYVLASVCNGSQGLPHFQVEARNEAWKGLQVSITVAVYVNVSGHQVYISKYHPGTVQVNGETRNLPVLLDQGKVSVYGNGLHTFVTTDFGLTVSYDGRWVLDITVPSNYSGATCGLCGNFNGLQADDFMVQNEGSGSQVLSASDFGNYWKVDDGIPCTGGCGNSCPVCHDDRRARAICELLRASTGPLSFCHAHVDPQTFFNDCVFDVCLSGNRDDVFCRAMEAYVSACQAANVIIYPWRQNSTCQMECPENSHYDLCGTECGHTCASSIDASCDRTCAEGCFCDEGFVRSGGRCVPVEQCGCLYDGLYFEIGETFWSAGCSQRCECFGPDDLRCTQSSCPPTQECSVKDGRRGCHGQLSTCTVWGDQFNGSAVQVGDSFWTDATCQQKCTCASGGILQCQQQSCSFSEACKPAAFQYSCQNIQRRTCTISGDPHYYTFDRKLFHFMGTCTYVLSEACGNGLPYYRIEGKNEHRGSTRVSWTRLVRVWVYGEEIELVKGHRYNAMVNGTFVTTPFSLKDGAIRVYQSGQSLAVSTDFGLLVTYDAHHYVTISVPYEYQNGTCGLCGNFNHQRNDDFRTRSGQLVSSDVEFANSWKVAGDTDPGCQDVSCAGLACAACTSSQKKLYGNTAHCGILSNNVGPFAACHSSLPPQNFEENCVYDLCVGGGYQPILCQGLTVYAAQCQQEGIQLGQWRRQGFCEISCPANSHFESQGTGCPATCSNPNAPKNCPLPNQESCICDAGYVLSAGECVRQGDCGCTFEGRYYGAGETVVLDEDCGRRCTCSHGSMTCQTHGCGDLEKCAVHEGVRGCRPASYETCWVESYESYRTFDGKTFHYPGACSLTLARVRGQSQLTHFQVTVEKVPKGLRDFVRTLKFETEGTQVSVEMGDGATTKVDGQTVGIPFSVSSGHIRIYHSSVKGVVIETDFGLLVRADWPHVIRITAPGNYNGTLGGLCGNLNGYPGDDFFSPTGVPLNNSQQFGDSWRDGSLSTHCVEPQVWEPGHYQNTTHFRELCGIMGSTNGPFGQCRANLDPSMQIEDCVQELERTQGAREALCEALRGYTLLCQQTGITVGEWRNLTNCEVTCPLNSHYEICGTSCPASCPSLSFPFLCNQQCQEGCQCDDGFLLSGDRCVPPTGCGCHHGGRYRQSGESYWYGEECQQICRCNGLTGQSHCTASSCSEQESCRIVDGQFGCHPKPEATCSASGDPHYTSFDRRKFDFQGTCRYVLASVCNGSQGLPHFQVEARNEAWKGLQVSITVAVYVNVSGHQVYISKYHPGTVQVNGETRNLPVLLDQGKVSVYGNGLHTFVTTDFGLTVSYDGRWVLDITVPSNYSGATCGLCGNFNGLQADDFMVQNEGSGSQVLSASDFGNYWKVDDGIPCTGGCGNSCPVCHDDRRARAICELLRASTGPLSFCHAHVDPQTFFNDCVFDVCLSGNRDDVFCRAMEAYVSACQAANVIIYPWRQNSTCQMECPENSHYDLCGTECGHTCASSIDASCDRTCAEGCFCDEGFVRSGGRCVPVEQCGCLYDGLYFEIGETFWSAGCSQRCECFGPDDLRCTQSSCPPTQECSVKDGRRGCHGQLSTCTVWGDQFNGSAVQVGDSFWTDATCQQKCTCASGGILQCQQQSCSFSEACKPAAFQYSCQNIQRRTCTISGDPHYYTFDRKLFHFMGTCTYVLSEACGNGLPYYRIEGKNEHRGSTRVSWTRLVRVWVYGEEIELVKGHRYNAMVNGTFVTTPFSLKDGAIRVYQSGQSLAVSTDFGLLVTYDAHHYVTISVPYEYQNGTCGLCGNFNHQRNDDFRTRSGQLVSSDVEFANSWKVAGDTDPGCQDVSCAGLACAACTSSQKKLYGNTAHCGILSNNVGPFAACHSSLPPQNFEENCVYDLCVGGGYQPILCQGLTVYAAQCQQEGIQLGQWRRQGFCEISCPANSHFESQGTGCPATCSNPNAPKNCPLPNQESCICDAGYVLSAGECVRQGDCGCTFEGRYYGAGETVVLDEDCGRRCTCSHGSMTCQTHGCGDLEKCAVHEGVRGCRPASYETCWVESYESYRTFDGKTFHYPGACSLTLARVRGQSQLTHFQVTVEKVPKGLRDFVRTLKFETEGTQVSVEMGDGATTKVDGQTVGIPFSVSSGHIRIYHSSVKGVVIETDFGLLVRADWPHVIRITAPGNYNGTLGGLCGNLNGYPGDDFFSPTGVPLNNSQQFGDSWRDGSLSTHCVEPQVWEPGHYQNTTHFRELCGIMGSTNGPFGQCRANLDPSMQIEDCVQELERTQGAREALCEALRGYTLLCQQTGITVGEWRNLTNCEVTCPLNSHYEICGTSCPASCPSLSFPFLCNQQCQEGCQCDDGFLLSGDRCVPPTGCGCHHGGRYRQSGESYWYGEECQQICRCNGLTGQSHCTASSCSEQESCRIVDGQFGCHPKPEATCSASGDPHYTSFDRRKFDFQGTCRYVLASVCNGSQGLPHFQVEARNEAWKGLQVSITVAVYVNVSGHQVYISKYHPGTVQVNGETRNLPVLLDQGKVSVYGNGLHTFVTTDFGLTVSYDGRWVLDITVPSNYSGATCGLCGNFNGLQADDFMVQNEGSGSQVLSASDFGNYWKVDDGIPCTGGCGNSCPVCHDDRRARAICELLRASTGPLSFCHAHVDPQTFFNDCVFDVCLSGNRDDVFCRAMEAYVSACQAANVIIYPWRQNSTCQMECPENSHYDLCGTECGHTCASSIDASCDRTCAEGCFCDEGFVRSGGRCVPVEQCGCLYDGLYFEIGETFWSAGCSQRCECFGPDDLRCTQSSCPPTQECSVKDGRRGCHGQLSTCTVWGDQFNGSAVQVGDSFWTDATCQQKCTCASGGILQCQQQSCSFSEACKPAAFQYSCQNIQRRTCTISGDPHYYTFDRKLFHFMGTCTYVLSEACGNGLPYYRIEGKNEHRGSTRVSWTRLVRVWVYGEEIELVKGHRYNAMVNGTFVTTPFSLKDGAIRVYQSGQSLAVSTDFGLLVTYDAHHYVTISVPYEYQNGTCGLCGNFNHQRNDDFRTRSGQLVSSDVEFANSWKVAGDTDPGCQDVSCAGLACAACTSSQKKLYGNTAHCGILSNNVGPFAACHSSLPPQNFEENCVYDLCVGGGYQPILCQGLTVYAAQCQQEGIQLGQWRRQGFCEISCPANSHFESQGTGCPATCSNPNAPKNCPLPNQESCICDAGYVLSAGECVRQGDCGCTFEGRYYGAGETVVLDEDCGRRCTCSHGSMTCQTHGCGDLEKCAVHEGVRGCRPASYETCWVESYESYRTFDGKTFHYPGACSLTLARVRGQSQLTHFQVTVEKVPKGLRDFVRTLKFETEGTQVSVEMGDGATTKVDGQTVGIPFSVSSGHIRIYHSSVKGVVIETDFGLLVRAYWPHVIRITAPGNYNGTLGGLCGNLNGYPGDDFFSPTGVPLNNSQQFGDSWRDGSLSTHCVEPQVWEPGHYQNTTHFRELCGIMGSTNGPFGQCRANLDPSMQIEDCVQELERTQGAREALCEALRGYTLLCQQTGITVGEWRNLTNCEVTCPLNSHYEICGTSCPASCPSLSFPFLCNQQCQEGCQCDDGFLLSGDRCVPPTGCGCHHGGRYRQSGESYWYGEECQQICRCNGLTGQSHCTTSTCSEQESCRIVDGQFGCHPKPEATCSASGDPHYTSFDRRKFDFQGTCRYVLASVCNGSQGLPHFQVEARNEAWKGLQVSITVAVYVNVSGHQVYISKYHPGTVQVNGETRNLPVLLDQGKVSVYGNGLHTFVTTDFGLTVSYDGRWVLDITVPSNYSGATCGLCGNFNGLQADDFMVQNEGSGSQVLSASDFGNYWKVDDGIPCTGGCGNSCPVCHDDRRARAICELLRASTGPLSFCHAHVDPQTFFNDCVFDVCLSGNRDDVFCRAMEAYVSACQAANVIIYPWRQNSTCQMECPENSHYDLCGTECGHTCASSIDASCDRTCAEGCFCDEGFVRSGGRCVPVEQCGCLYDGLYFEIGETFWSAGCSQRCECFGPDDLRCTQSSCPPTQECSVKDGRRGCHGQLSTCTVWGDPHYITFDGAVAHFQGTCSYEISHTCGNVSQDALAFRVVAANSHRGNLVVSFVSTVDMWLSRGGVQRHITIGQNRRVKIDGQEKNANSIQIGSLAQLTRDSGFVVVNASGELVVQFDGRSRLLVRLNPRFHQSVCGMCGNNNGNPADDKALPNGNLAQTDTQFGQSWKSNVSSPGCGASDRIGDDVCLFREEYTELCSIISNSSGPFQPCHLHVDPQAYVTSCVYDLCAYTPANGMLCSAVEAYETACSVLGLQTSEWRSALHCSAADPCEDLDCTEDEWCGQKDGVYGCFCNEDHARPQCFDSMEQCSSSTGTMSLSRCQLFEAGFSADALHLNDPSCNGTLQDGRLEFFFNNSNHICGTSLRSNSTHFIYENSIQGEANAASGPISRERQIHLNFSCAYPLTQTLSMNVDINPIESVVTKTLPAGAGTYRVRMIPFEDAGFSHAYSGRVNVAVNQRLYMEVRVEGVDSRQIATVVDSCWATPVNQPNYHTRWDLIKNECPNPIDNTVELLQNGVSTAGRFSFRMFTFTADSSKVYLHCSIHLCLMANNDCTPHCNPGNPVRQRRSVDFHDSAAISLGPLVWDADTADGKAMRSPRLVRRLRPRV